MDVSLVGSQPGVTYRLLRNGIPYVVHPDMDQDGSGLPLNWACINEIGSYTIQGLNDETGVSTIMQGSALVTPQPLPEVYQIVPTGDTCLLYYPRLNGSKPMFATSCYGKLRR